MIRTGKYDRKFFAAVCDKSGVYGVFCVRVVLSNYQNHLVYWATGAVFSFRNEMAAPEQVYGQIQKMAR